MTDTSQTAETFLFTTKRQPPELIAALRLILAEGVHIGWSKAWQESRQGVLIELPRPIRRAVFDLGAAEMAVPEQVWSQTFTDDSGEEVQAGRLLITAEGRRLLDLLEGPIPAGRIQRPARPGELCTCGHPARMVYRAEGRVFGSCEIEGQAPLLPCPFCGSSTAHTKAWGDSAACPQYRLNPSEGS